MLRLCNLCLICNSKNFSDAAQSLNIQILSFALMACIILYLILQNSGVAFSFLFSIYALILTRSRLGLFQVCIIFLTFVSVIAQYLEIKWIEFHQILYMHLY